MSRVRLELLKDLCKRAKSIAKSFAFARFVILRARPVVGGYGEDFLVAFTSAIHGYAVATLIMDLRSRIMG